MGNANHSAFENYLPHDFLEKIKKSDEDSKRFDDEFIEFEQRIKRFANKNKNLLKNE